MGGRIPRQDGIFFTHFNLKTPSNFYIGRGNHGYYWYEKDVSKGYANLDSVNDHPVWLDPDPGQTAITRWLR